MRSDPYNQKAIKKPVDDTLSGLRTGALNRLAWVVLLLGGTAVVAGSIGETRSGRRLFILIYGLAYLSIVTFSVVRRWSLAFCPRR